MAVVPGRLQALCRRVYKFLSTGVRHRNYWPNNISNTELVQRTNMEPVHVRKRRQKWGCIGHILRKDKKCNARKAMEWKSLISGGKATWQATRNMEKNCCSCVEDLR